MGLRQTAETDLGKILEDTNGFSWSITVTDPAETSVVLNGFTNDISQLIDPDTGQAVSGRQATISIRIALLTAAGLSIPIGIADTTSKPWVISFNDVNGNTHYFKVMQSNPDRTIGIVTCYLELYQP